jgi:hypothetical protein
VRQVNSHFPQLWPDLTPVVFLMKSGSDPTTASYLSRPGSNFGIYWLG